jgi:hypothetical protein
MQSLKLSELPEAIRCYFEAVKANNGEELANCFTEDGVIVDVDRAIAGRRRIREWAQDEVLGGTYNFIDLSGDDQTVSLLLSFAPRDEEPFRARYEFKIQNGQIFTANLQYA